MRRAKKIQPILIAALCGVFGPAAFADGNEPSNRLEIIDRIQGIELTAEQQQEIRGLIDKYGPRIKAAEKAAVRTKEQKQACETAIQGAIEAGKCGAAAAEFIGNACDFTESQEQAMLAAARLSRELNSKLQSVLTKKQWSKLKSAYTPADKSGLIVVRLSPDLPKLPPDAKKFSEVARQLKLDGILGVLEKYMLPEPERLIRNIPKQKDNAPPPRTKLLNRLQSYWRIDAREQEQQIDQIVKELNELDEVDTAYEQFTFSEPSVTDSDDPYCPRQEYLNPAPEGIDARFAWTQPNGSGGGIGLVDLERGWHQDHEDFQMKARICFGDQRPDSRRHGTAVLGEAIADDNTIGVVGVATSASYVFMTSHYDPILKKGVDPANAILTVLPLMCPGDVLLIEVQAEELIGSRKVHLPAEVDDAVFDAIVLAVSDGIVVVAAAGNGRFNLDSYQDDAGQHILRRAVRDSGAIFVGACDANIVHDRLPASNFGSIIDCYSYGRVVTTTGFKGDLKSAGGPNSTYTRTFNGTSSAAPIIAGAAMVLQGMAKANSSTLLTSQQMRSILADPATGTAQGANVVGPIGVMPDLKAIINTHGVFR